MLPDNYKSSINSSGFLLVRYPLARLGLLSFKFTGFWAWSSSSSSISPSSTRSSYFNKFILLRLIFKLKLFVGLGFLTISSISGFLLKAILAGDVWNALIFALSWFKFSMLFLMSRLVWWSDGCHVRLWWSKVKQKMIIKFWANFG